MREVAVNASSDQTLRSAERAARWTRGLLMATAVLTVVGVWSGVLQVQLLSRAAAGGISHAEVTANDSRQQFIGLLQFVLFLGTAVAFLVWFRAAHRNLTALGCRNLKYTPGWAVGGFFVPVLNLVRPLQVMREVWRGSDPSNLERGASAEAPARRRLRAPTIVGWWWALFLTSGFVGNIAIRMAFAQNPSLDQLQALSAVLVLSDFVDLPSSLVALRLVGQITKRQAQRRDRLSEVDQPVLAEPGPQGV
jgi:hypothetical protein